MKLSLPKKILLAKPWQYSHVYNHGKRIRGNGFSLIFLDNGQKFDRLGISVSGVRVAVKRNTIKRLLKEFYRHNRSFPSLVSGKSIDDNHGTDLVIATNKRFHPQGLTDIEKTFLPFIN